MHEWDGLTPLEEMLHALDRLISQGKIRYIGCSNYTGWQLMKSLGISNSCGYQRFVTQQIHYTLEARKAEYELLPISVDQGLGVLVWSPLAGGLLTGAHRRGQPTPPGSRQAKGWSEPPIRDEERLWNIVDELVAIAQSRGVTPAQVALAWLLDRPAITSLVVGGVTQAHFQDNICAVELELTAEENKRLDDVSAIPSLYPYWHQFNFARDRFSEADWALQRNYMQDSRHVLTPLSRSGIACFSTYSVRNGLSDRLLTERWASYTVYISNTRAADLLRSPMRFSMRQATEAGAILAPMTQMENHPVRCGADPERDHCRTFQAG